MELKEEMAIHCDTKEKAEILLIAFETMGKRWSSGDRYLRFDNYHVYSQHTCYSNCGQFCSYEYYEERVVKIYEFDEINDILLKEC